MVKHSVLRGVSNGCVFIGGEFENVRDPLDHLSSCVDPPLISSCASVVFPEERQGTRQLRSLFLVEEDVGVAESAGVLVWLVLGGAAFVASCTLWRRSVARAQRDVGGMRGAFSTLGRVPGLVAEKGARLLRGPLGA